MNVLQYVPTAHRVIVGSIAFCISATLIAGFYRSSPAANDEVSMITTHAPVVVQPRPQKEFELTPRAMRCLFGAVGGDPGSLLIDESNSDHSRIVMRARWKNREPASFVVQPFSRFEIEKGVKTLSSASMDFTLQNDAAIRFSYRNGVFQTIRPVQIDQPVIYETDMNVPAPESVFINDVAMRPALDNMRASVSAINQRAILCLK